MNHKSVPAESILHSNGADVNPSWGSDAIAEQLARLDLQYLALVPGSSFRGLHDSLVNFTGPRSPQMLLCLHEEHAVALAHGYAKVTRRPMAVALHANVGLMHATMAIYDAYVDRVPILIIGATGPVDASIRRPWIDWIHSSRDQAALIRPYVKFDDQPQSVDASLRSLLRAAAVTMAKPTAPTYVCLDVGVQEQRLGPEPIQFPETSRYLQIPSYHPARVDVQRVIQAISHSRYPLFLFGRGDRSQESWNRRVALAEHWNARVMTDMKQGAVFPSAHRLHACPPSTLPTEMGSQILRIADLIVSFDWVDLAGTLQNVQKTAREPAAEVIHISLDAVLHNGWSMDHFGQPPVDLSIAADPDLTVADILEASTSSSQPGYQVAWQVGNADSILSPPSTGERIYMQNLAEALYSAISPADMCLIRLPLGWRPEDMRITHPLAYLGIDGGGGVGSGPGMAVGAALALKDSPLLPVAILGDGDFLMGSSALWTASHYRVPLLVIVANNASFYNDEAHQERVARHRGRPVENKGIGIRIEDPLPDLSQNAASLGLTVLGRQVTRCSDLEEILQKAVNEVKLGKAVVVDVAVLPDGYMSVETDE